jgi:uncharacterized protein YndB with AHSA1/START domain
MDQDLRQMERNKITIKSTIETDIITLWHAYTEPNQIVQWNFASDDWQCPWAESDLKVGGKYTARMEARDGSYGFNFQATYTEIRPYERIVYVMDDGRVVSTTFLEANGVPTITTVFDAETQNPVEMQRKGWQSILENLKRYIQNTQNP